MPIKLNLLAEAQQLDELRRRDPVKRFILAGVLVILIILGWSSSLMVEAMLKRGEISRLAMEVQAQENSYKQILEDQNALVEGKRRIAALDRLAANRFLVGTLLNTFQTNTVEHVQLTRLKVDHNYELVPEVKPTSRSSRRSIPKPATIKENITVSLAAKDRSPVPGDGVSKFQTRLSNDGYFKKMLDQNGFRLITLSPAQVDVDGKPFLLMGLEGKLPEKVR